MKFVKNHLHTSLIQILCLSATVVISGCSNTTSTDNPEETPAELNIPKTPPLEAGNSVSSSLTKPMPVQANNSRQDAQQTTTDNTQVATPSAQPRSSNTLPQGEITETNIVLGGIQPDTPEFTFKLAMNTLYFGTVKEASEFYHVDIENFDQELLKTQTALKETVEKITYLGTKYSADKKQAVLKIEFSMKDSAEPSIRGFKLEKIDGKWKIVL